VIALPKSPSHSALGYSYLITYLLTLISGVCMPLRILPLSHSSCIWSARNHKPVWSNLYSFSPTQYWHIFPLRRTLIAILSAACDAAFCRFCQWLDPICDCSDHVNNIFLFSLASPTVSHEQTHFQLSQTGESAAEGVHSQSRATIRLTEMRQVILFSTRLAHCFQCGLTYDTWQVRI